MAITFNFGTGAQGDSVSKTLKPWLYTAAFRATSYGVGNATMVNTKTDLDKKTSIKVTLSKIANVFETLAKGTIPVANQLTSQTGHTVFCELKTIATKSVGTEVAYIPIVSRIEIRVPDDPDITDSDIETLVLATYAGLCNQAGTSDVMSDKLRGALTPAGV